jgi:hypothetical protein
MPLFGFFYLAAAVILVGTCSIQQKKIKNDKVGSAEIECSALIR